MTKILDRLPRMPQTRSVRFGERFVTIHRDQLLVWISIGLQGAGELEGLSPAFPALLDTGSNYDFFLHEHHLVHWSGIHPARLPLLGRKHINQRETPCHQADVWIYRNHPGTTDLWKEMPAFRLEIPDGVAMTPLSRNQPVYPRLPLLGSPALRKNCWIFGSTVPLPTFIYAPPIGEPSS